MQVIPVTRLVVVPVAGLVVEMVAVRHEAAGMPVVVAGVVPHVTAVAGEVERRAVAEPVVPSPMTEVIDVANAAVEVAAEPSMTGFG